MARVTVDRRVADKVAKRSAVKEAALVATVVVVIIMGGGAAAAAVTAAGPVPTVVLVVGVAGDDSGIHVGTGKEDDVRGAKALSSHGMTFSDAAAAAAAADGGLLLADDAW